MASILFVAGRQKLYRKVANTTVAHYYAKRSLLISPFMLEKPHRLHYFKGSVSPDWKGLQMVSWIDLKFTGYRVMFIFNLNVVFTTDF
jgi:hypothetical protein